MKIIALLATASTLGYMSDTCEVILAKMKGNSEPVRINKSDFDADQDKPASDRRFSPYSGKDEPEQSDTASAPDTFEALGMEPVAAASAPDFKSVGTSEPMPTDPIKGAAAPAAPSENARLVTKKGSKWFVVNERGEKIEGGAIDTDGYKTEAEARIALGSLPR